MIQTRPSGLATKEPAQSERIRPGAGASSGPGSPGPPPSAPQTPPRWSAPPGPSRRPENFQVLEIEATECDAKKRAETSVMQQKGNPKDFFSPKGRRFPKVSQKWLDKPLDPSLSSSEAGRGVVGGWLDPGQPRVSLGRLW